ncbi:hypothetical protein ARALYDRAFT_918837 [Arabidopsis lyrata subsp. lyrata]|uniref:Uncharacterized protein n=1 Tax=Arabidopsis lyrata subsp. lyrata TaxID=81972 RepID=D7MM71_ARALL|nr:hypothetical protein ARALYDRAFT_918837 [Arabidopsis lyrata subsp. lyrata]
MKAKRKVKKCNPTEKLYVSLATYCLLNTVLFLQARDTRLKMIEEMSEETKEAFQNMKFYKFYPQLSPDVPRFKTSPCINRYYGNAHQVL